MGRSAKIRARRRRRHELHLRRLERALCEPERDTWDVLLGWNDDCSLTDVFEHRVWGRLRRESPGFYTVTVSSAADLLEVRTSFERHGLHHNSWCRMAVAICTYVHKLWEEQKPSVSAVRFCSVLRLGGHLGFFFGRVV